MKQFTLSLDETSSRPIVLLNNWNKIRALLDTGSFLPVWTADENLLTHLGGVCIKKDVPFGGFGGTTKGNLYKLSNIVIGDLIFPNIHIIACKDLNFVPFQLILSATMFRNLIYEIDDKHHKLNVTIPDNESTVRNLIIQSNDGKIKVLCGSDADISNEETRNLAAGFQNVLKNMVKQQ